MKASMIRLTGGLILGALSAAAVAGQHESHEVVLTTTKGFASGDLGYVHNTADTVQYIGCQYSTTNGSCFAVDSSGASRSCTTTDPDLLANIRALKSDSHLTFAVNPDGVTCKIVNVSVDSRTAPKQ